MRTNKIPSEVALMLSCARFQRALTSDAKESLDRRVEWVAFQRLVEWHGVATLTSSRLQSGPDNGGAEVARRIRESRNVSTRRALFLAGRLVRLLDRFDAAAIPIIPLKGPALSEYLYGDLAFRQFVDLDVLVHRNDVPAAMRLLEQDGYRLDCRLFWAPEETLLALNCELRFERECGTSVDLHWEVAPSDYPFRFDAEILWNSLRPMSFSGRTVRGLSPECLLLFLCVHGAKHKWWRLQWLCDVARLVEISGEMDWPQVFEMAGPYGGEHVVLLGLSLAHEVLDAPLPENVLRRLAQNRVIQPLVEEVLEHLLRIDPSVPTGLDLVRFNARMATRPWDKVRHFASLLRSPTEADAEILQLPPTLFFLYYPFRFVRLAWKYTWTRGLARLLGRPKLA